MENVLSPEKVLPRDILQDVETVESILRRHGALKIILYGSLARGDYQADSDIDICVDGIPADRYFRVLAECLMETHRRVSVLNLEDTQGYLRERILREGKILYESQ